MIGKHIRASSCCHAYKMAANERICLGCGDDVSDKSGNRRSLKWTIAGRCVFKKWEIQMNEKFEPMDMAAVTALVEEQFDGGLMCRSCFSSYERLQKL